MKSTASSGRFIPIAQRTPASPAERLSSGLVICGNSFLSSGIASRQRPASASATPLGAGLRGRCAVASETNRIIGRATEQIVVTRLLPSIIQIPKGADGIRLKKIKERIQKKRNERNRGKKELVFVFFRPFRYFRLFRYLSSYASEEELQRELNGPAPLRSCDS